ncbi:type II toxin-antitoxin system HicA family toxin [Psychromonas arctica]|uniref:type II toxin-antitoxin system HicA family toxin n=1 Tax=Psychromonas arctica TaxID=168275 RepID=UPI002FD2BE41
MKSSELIKLLESAGYKLVRVKGSHHIFKHESRKTICVPHPKKELQVGIVNRIKKDAGL